MKKLLFITAMGLMPAWAHAQFAEGNILLGGSIGFNSSKTESQPDDIKTSGYQFSPQVLYFVNPNIAVGLNFGIEGTKSKPSDDKTTDLHFGPAVRFQGKWVERASCYGQLNIDIGSGSEERKTTYFDPVTFVQTDYTRKDKYSTVGATLFPGINYMVKPHFYLDMRYGMLSYGSRNNKPDNSHGTVEDYKTSGFVLNLDLTSLMLGAYVTF
ncbi:MAG: outer membrane beta-barrel protein [Bacteroidota bacterium]